MVELLLRVPQHRSPAQALVNEMNKARMNPITYISTIEKYRARHGRLEPGAVDEAIQALRSHPPCRTPLRLEPSMSRIVDSLLEEQARTGDTGHGSFLGRVSQVGTYRAIAENIAYGTSDAEDTVAAWIIDAGVPNRGHRINLLNCNYEQVGYGDARHPRFGNAVAVVYAMGFRPYS